VEELDIQTIGRDIRCSPGFCQSICHSIALENRKEHPYLHLFDGGLGDNLGLRAMLDGVLRYNSINEAMKALGMEKTRKVVIILVNAETALDVESSRRMQSPTFTAALSAATSVPLQRYSFETMALLKDRLAEWQRESYTAACGTASNPVKGVAGKGAGEECKGVDFHFI
jgi:hypothetical protein